MRILDIVGEDSIVGSTIPCRGPRRPFAGREPRLDEYTAEQGSTTSHEHLLANQDADIPLYQRPKRSHGTSIDLGLDHVDRLVHRRKAHQAVERQLIRIRKCLRLGGERQDTPRRVSLTIGRAIEYELLASQSEGRNIVPLDQGSMILERWRVAHCFFDAMYSDFGRARGQRTRSNIENSRKVRRKFTDQVGEGRIVRPTYGFQRANARQDRPDSCSHGCERNGP